jgi:SAM-dependent methyltransferase
MKSQALMSSKISNSNYSPYARIYNEEWGEDLSIMALKFLEKVLIPKLSQKVNILDLCCGTGQLAKYLLEKRYYVTGLDLSETMLNYARQNAPAAKFIQGDVRSFKLSSSFDAVICTPDNLNYILTLQELTSVFQNVYTTLSDKGIFVFILSVDDDYQTEESDEQLMAGNVKDEYVWGIRVKSDLENRTFVKEVTILEPSNGAWRRSDITWTKKSYSKVEVLSALKNVGFSKISICNLERDFAIPKEFGSTCFVCHK